MKASRILRMTAAVVLLSGCSGAIGFLDRFEAELSARGVVADGELTPSEAGAWIAAYMAADGPIDPPDVVAPLAVRACNFADERVRSDLDAEAEVFCDGLLDRE